ncbi:unnamed protein product [Trichobilharzia regenti]|nr:unnamed protein product [Trichobilharzia regenti]
MGSSIQSDQMAYEPIWVTGNHGNAAPDAAPLPSGLDSESKARGVRRVGVQNLEAEAIAAASEAQYPAAATGTTDQSHQHHRDSVDGFNSVV